MVATSETGEPQAHDWPAEAVRHGRYQSFREGRFRSLVESGLVRVPFRPATEFCLRAPALPVAAKSSSRLLEIVATALSRGVSAGVDLAVVPPAHVVGWLEALAALASSVSAGAAGDASAQVIGSLPDCYPGLNRRLRLRPGEPANFGVAVTCSRPASRLPAELQQQLLYAGHLGLRRYPVNSGPLAGPRPYRAASACLPQSRFCVAPGQAWLTLELNLAQLGGAAGMRRKIIDCLHFADALTTSRTWGVPALVTDAILNRRVAWVLTGLARKVNEAGYDPADFATLRGLRRWLYAVRRCIVHESARIDRQHFVARASRQAARGPLASSGFRRAGAVGAHILVASPDALLPVAGSAEQHIDGAWLNLFPALACTDALAAPGPASRRLSYANWCRMVSLSRAFATG